MEPSDLFLNLANSSRLTFGIPRFQPFRLTIACFLHMSRLPTLVAHNVPTESTLVCNMSCVSQPKQVVVVFLACGRGLVSLWTSCCHDCVLPLPSCLIFRLPSPCSARAPQLSRMSIATKHLLLTLQSSSVVMYQKLW